MKKIFYLLFICSIALASCTKQEPITCNCSGSSSLDTALVGHWQATGLTSADGTSFDNDRIDLYILSDGSYVITTSVTGNLSENFGTIRETSISKKIIIDTEDSENYAVFNYNIQNGILILSPDLGTDLFWVVGTRANNDFMEYIRTDYVVINNLTKQY